MAEIGPTSEVWAKSLRQETALQDHYRRAIHHGDSGVENVGFDRWNAACCLQEQVDSTRGVEHTRRLIQSRAIAARFTRRSVMKDLQGTELQATFVRANSTCGGVSGEDDSLTRSQALEMIGIDLGRVGVMTSARTASRHSLIDCGSVSDQGTARGGEGERVAIATKPSSDVGGIARGKAEQRANRTEVKRSGGGVSGMTSVTKGDSKTSSKELTERRQEVMSKKLKVLDKLLSDELVCQKPADEVEEKKGETTKESMPSEEDKSLGVPERNGTGNQTSVDIIVELGNGGNGKWREARLDVLPGEKAPPCARLVEKTAYGCEDPQALAPEPKKARIAADIHVPDEGERGAAADTRNAVPPENGRVTDFFNVERHHRCKEALPKHRPCLWWASLLPPEVEGVCIPDMVFSAPIAYPSCCNKLGRRTEAAEAASSVQNNARRTTPPLPSTSSRTDTVTNAPAGSATKRPPSKSSSRQSLLWAFSKAVKHEGGDAGGAGISTDTASPNPHLGVASLVEGEGCGGGPAMAYPFTQDISPVGKFGFSKENSSPAQHPHVVQQRLHTKVIDGKEGLICATRAICECGTRGGGGTGSEGGPSKLKLPLALLKLWGRESDEERGRNTLPGKLGTPCRGRRLTVISLWTQTEVFGALRDMARGRWLRRGEQFEQVSGLFGGDQDACCVQAFTKSARYTDGGDNDPRDGVGVGVLKAVIVDGGGHQSRCERRAPPEDNGLSGPVFYRAAWRRTGELFVWKITSRYPYVSSLSAHFCPLVRVGSAAPFTASQAEERAAATAKLKTENLAKVLRRAYDSTLQRLWADWAVNESDGRWLLIEVHGIKNDADIRNAAAARAAPPAFAEVKSKVYGSKHGIPPKHFCGDPVDLKARIAAANPTQELSLVEIAKRAAVVASKHQPSRPPTPSRIAASTKKALLTQRGAVSGQERSRREGAGLRQMRNQYWRCAGDFCETHSAGQRQKSPSHRKINHDNPNSAVERQSPEGARMKKGCGATTLRGTGIAEDEGHGGGTARGGGTEYEVEDIVGRRKHALAVETPRTVLFRLVLNARAALLGWRPSAFDFSQMEKPVQLCSACFTVCNTLERERIETTRRAMDAAEQAAKEGKARRDRRPPGWKSRVQHELEESLNADRRVVSRLIDSFETTASATAEGKKKRAPSSSASSIGRGNNQVRPRQKESGGGEDGGVSVTWADRSPLAEVRVDGEEDRADASAQSTPRGKISALAAGKTTLAASTKRTTTAPLAPTPGKKRLSPAQQPKMIETASFLDARAKGKPKDEGKKREIRARRKAKERARRRLRSLAPDDSSGRNGRGEEPGKKENKADFAGGDAGRTDNTGRRDYELPRILRPTAPAPLSRKVVADDVLTSDAHSTETSGRPRQLANSTSPDRKLGEEDEVRGGHEGGESSIDGVTSEYDDEDFVDDTQPQLLRPIAPLEIWEAKEGIAPEGQGESEEIGCASVDREGFNSDYGDDDFEDEAT